MVLLTRDAGFQSNTTRSNCTYDVFLSFRGEDTRKTFIDRLYDALVDAGYHTFIDNHEIERGENIKLELIRAINQSRSSILVISENYASSTWCLDELLMILENKKTKEHIVMPMFYHIDPSEVQDPTGSFAKALAKHENRFFLEIDEGLDDRMSKVKAWRAALREVSNIGGMVLQKNVMPQSSQEAWFIQKIVEVIEYKLKHAAHSGGHSPIGIDAQVDHISMWLQDRSSVITTLVICGIAGIGKTTLAKIVYNKNYERFDGSCFLENVRETSRRSNGLVELQRDILSGILNRKQERILNVEEGVARLKDAICCRRIILILDDVDQLELLDAIIGSTTDWFHLGSKIIITTRLDNLLKSYDGCAVHKLRCFHSYMSLQIFAQHAFGQKFPSDAWMDFAGRIIDRCQGLPLALKVLGSSLSGKSMDVWESVIRKLEAIPNNKIQDIIKSCYDCLADEHDKNLFLHVACFFVGKDIALVVKVLDKCGFHTQVGIENLINRCLVEIDDNNRLKMHQLIQDMAREVVRQESPKVPSRRSRIWHHKDSLNILRDKKISTMGTDVIEGLSLDMRYYLENDDDTFRPLNSFVKRECFTFLSWFQYPASMNSDDKVLETDAFFQMDNLKFLELNNVQLKGNYRDFPKGLRWLCWRGFSSKCLPVDFPLESVVALEMTSSSLECIWQGNKDATQLKILDLSHSHKLLRTPDFSRFPNLETLILKDCISLLRVHESVGHLVRLVFMNLEGCRSLKELPRSIENLKNLETLIVSGCSSLNELPSEVKWMESLKVLNAEKIMKCQLGSATHKTNFWQAPLCSWVSKPRKFLNVSLPHFPQSLVSLSLVDCNLLEDAFPLEFGNLVCLQKLDLSKNPMCSLPEGIRRLSSLQTLRFESCHLLQSLIGLPDVKELYVHYCKSLKAVTHLSTNFKVEYLGISDYCKKLAEVHGYFKIEPIGELCEEFLDALVFFKLQMMADMHVNFFDGISTFYPEKYPIQLLYEFGIFSTSILAKELPEWFGTRSTGSSISFVVPSQFHGLNICFLYVQPNSKNKEADWFPLPFFVSISNKTKDLRWIYNPTCFGIPEAEEMLWLSHWSFRNELECGDEVDVSVVIGNEFQVKECGINFVYQELGEDIQNSYLSWKEVIGGDLQAYRLSTGEYLLCRATFTRNNEAQRISERANWSTTSWGKSLFDLDSINFTEIDAMTWFVRYNGYRRAKLF